MQNDTENCAECGCNKWVDCGCPNCLGISLNRPFPICSICSGVEWTETICSKCGHPDTWHNFNHTGRCQTKDCKCDWPELGEQCKQVSFYNETYKSWCSPFVLKCTCRK
jgi:hypothetical protein